MLGGDRAFPGIGRLFDGRRTVGVGVDRDWTSGWSAAGGSEPTVLRPIFNELLTRDLLVDDPWLGATFLTGPPVPPPTITVADINEMYRRCEAAFEDLPSDLYVGRLAQDAIHAVAEQVVSPYTPVPDPLTTLLGVPIRPDGTLPEGWWEARSRDGRVLHIGVIPGRPIGGDELGQYVRRELAVMVNAAEEHMFHHGEGHSLDECPDRGRYVRWALGQHQRAVEETVSGDPAGRDGTTPPPSDGPGTPEPT